MIMKRGMLMGRKLLLSNLGFPEKFLASSISPTNGLTQQQYMEQEVIKSINYYNPKLKVTDIEYLDIKQQFPHLKIGKYAGLIVEDFSINQVDLDIYRNEEYFVWSTNNNWYARKIIIYVFLSDYEAKGRNIISQSIFPEIIEFMGMFIASPSYTIANHPIYYINILSKEITAPTIIKQISGMIASNIEYIEVFTKNDELSYVPRDIYEYLKKFEKDFIPGNLTCSTNYYEVDFSRKIATIKIDRLALNDYVIPKVGTISGLEFKGSSEKFYWMEIIPIIILASDNEYTIDYSLLENFYNQNIDKFSENDDKFYRFSLLIKFIKKLMLRGEV